MGNWTWEGLNKEGKRDAGTVAASSEKDARRLIRAKGVRLRKLNPPSFL